MGELLRHAPPALCGLIGVLLFCGCGTMPASPVTFSRPAPALDAYDYVEIAATVAVPTARNPFTDASLDGVFERADGSARWPVRGFCDAPNGRTFRIRFMPPTAGQYRYAVTYRQGGSHATTTGGFAVRNGGRRGPLRVDVQHPWHFVWEGTGEHYFWFGTTAYWLSGWRDDRPIAAALERLHRLRVNRIRVTVAGRTNVFYGEPVMPGETWTPLLTPWPAGFPEDIYHPRFDYSRFDVAHWQKLDRLLRFARDRDIIISLVLDMNDSRVHPEAGSADERRFIRYAVDRFAAFSNITWDLGDDLDSYRDETWTHMTGTWLKAWDPYRHLATSHPVAPRHQDRTSDWFDFTSFQEWSQDQHAFMLRERRRQEQLGRIIPLTNEEYGYEDHYPLWALGPGFESADALRRRAWAIYMAGGYQTAGETARRGTHVWPDSGGGWMNGRGDDTMTMFQGYGHLLDFFTAFEWWKTAPHDELVSDGNYCLANPSQVYVVYLPAGGPVTVRLDAGRYTARLFDAATGRTTDLGFVESRSWSFSGTRSGEDAALLITRVDDQQR